MTTATQTPASSGQERTEGHLDPAARLTGVRQPGIPDSNEFVPVQTRSERPTSFDPADFGTPVGTEVNWKHTPLKAIAELLRDEPAPHDVIGVEVSAAGVAEHYGARGHGGVLDGWLVDSTDVASVDRITAAGLRCDAVPLLMTDADATADMVVAALDLVR